MNARQESNIRRFLLPALRSGLFEQGRCALHRIEPTGHSPDIEHQYCCLGVATDLIMHDQWQPWNTSRMCVHNYLIGGNSTNILPYVATKFYGINETGDFFVIRDDGDESFIWIKDDRGYPDDLPDVLSAYDHRAFSLVSLNDDGVPFPRIADVIAWVLDSPRAKFSTPRERPVGDIDMDELEDEATRRMSALGIPVPGLAIA